MKRNRKIYSIDTGHTLLEDNNTGEKFWGIAEDYPYASPVTITNDRALEVIREMWRESEQPSSITDERFHREVLRLFNVNVPEGVELMLI